MHPVFFEIHSGNLREAPGSDDSTRLALSMIPELSKTPRILDIGCGPGAQSIVLAKETGGTVIAVDNHEPFLEELRRRAREAGVAERVKTEATSMFELPFEEKSFDLIWSEGAVYIMGFEEGLETWRTFLKPGGYIAVSELSWLTQTIPEEPADYWREGYPGMSDIAGNKLAIERAGLELIGNFTLPKKDWTENYYGPIGAKLKNLEKKYHYSPEALEVIAAERAEIELYQAYNDYYGYEFFIMRKPRN